MRGVPKETIGFSCHAKGTAIYMKGKTKYKNTKIDTKYGKFDSKREYSIWLRLLREEELGNISDLKRQFPFELISASKYGRSIKYIADFVYIDKKTNELIVADCKGFIPAEFKLKARLFSEKYNTEIKILK